MKDFDDLSPLSSEARALLTETRAADDPAPEDRDRVKRALMATLASTAGLAASTAASSAAASAAGTAAVGGLSFGAKLAAVVLLAGAVGGTVWVAPWQGAPVETVRPGPSAAATVDPSPAHAPSAPAAAASRSLPPPPLEEPGAQPLAPSPAPTAIPPAPVAAPIAPVARVRPRTSAVVAAAPAVPAEAAPALPPPSTLGEEVRLLRRAQSAIREGDPSSALATLADHAARFPSGALAEERQAARVVALCDAGQAEAARAAAAEFLRDRPGSPLAARVRTACP